MRISGSSTIIFLTAALLLNFCFVSNARALSISPLRHTVVLGPAQAQTVAIEIVNTEKNTMQVTSETEAFSLDSLGKIRFGSSDEATGWVKVTPKQALLRPGQKSTFFFTITAPSVGFETSRYLALFIKETGASGQIGVGQRLGSLLFVHPAGRVQENLEVNYWYPVQHWTRIGGINWYLRLHNGSTIHVLPHAEVKLKTVWGSSIYSKKIVAGDIILPQGNLEKIWADTRLPWWVIGPVDATLTVTYGLTNTTTQIERMFWYWPVESIYFLVGCGILLTSIITLRMRLGRHKV